jgi:hypothetical protein
MLTCYCAHSYRDCPLLCSSCPSHTHTHTHIHTNNTQTTHTHTHTYIHTCYCARSYRDCPLLYSSYPSHTYTHTHTNKQTNKHTHTHAHIPARVLVHIVTAYCSALPPPLHQLLHLLHCRHLCIRVSYVVCRM